MNRISTKGVLASCLALSLVWLLASCATYKASQKRYDEKVGQLKSKSNLPQGIALMNKATPEIFKRYPNTQGIAYNSVAKRIDIDMFSYPATEEYKRKVQLELTQLVQYPVKVNFMTSPLTLPIQLDDS